MVVAVRAAVAAQKVKKPLSDGAELVAFAANDAEWPNETTTLERPGCEHAGLHFAAHRRLGQQSDAEPLGHGLLDRLRVVERRLDPNPDAVIAEKALDFLADDQAALEVDVLRLVELAWAAPPPDRRTGASSAQTTTMFSSRQGATIRPRACFGNDTRPKSDVPARTFT